MRYAIGFTNKITDMFDLSADEIEETQHLMNVELDVRPVAGDVLSFWSRNGDTLYTARITEVRLCGQIDFVDGQFRIVKDDLNEIDAEWLSAQ